MASHQVAQGRALPTALGRTHRSVNCRAAVPFLWDPGLASCYPWPGFFTSRWPGQGWG